MARKVFLYFFLYFLFFTTRVFAVPAFPGAEGFGANAVGGKGGTVYEVTNLNDSGPGSLRECVAASGPRVCIFKVGGTILLSSTLTISNPYITIAGQTALGGGITLKHASGGIGIQVQTYEVIIRYITSRPGPGGQNQALIVGSNGGNVYNVIVDHCSLSWATDEIATTWYAAHNITFQWLIISEGLDCSTHPKGCHSKGALLGGYAGSEAKTTPGAKDISFHHNLMAHNGERGPMIKTSGLVDVVNNVTYNPYWTFAHFYLTSTFSGYNVKANFVGNYFKRGPSSTSNTGIKHVDEGGLAAQVYVQGNIGPTRSNDSLPESDIVDSGSRGYLVSTRILAPSITTANAADAYNQVLAGAGNTQGLDSLGNFTWRRDAIDQRIVNDVKNGTGKIINDPSEVGGWLIIASGTTYTDSDHDGMPDSWENKYGFNPGNAADGPSDADGDGYTNLEEFLNATNPISTPTPTVVLCARKGEGDANCDGLINILDFEIWRREFLGIDSTTKADFDSSGGITILDFEIWRRGFLGQ